VTEACNGTDEAYGSERLVALISADGATAPAALVDRICRGVTNFTGPAPQADDITVAVLAWEAH